MGCCNHNKLSHRLKSNGDINFVRKGPEPPPDLQGYKRNSGDDWLFHPITTSYLPCGSAIDFSVKEEGMTAMGRLCTHPDTQVTVSPKQCASCSLRWNREAGEQGPVQVSRRKTILQRIMSHIINYTQLFAHIS